MLEANNLIFYKRAGENGKKCMNKICTINYNYGSMISFINRKRII